MLRQKIRGSAPCKMRHPRNEWATDMKRKRTTLALIEPDRGIAEALARLFARERTDLTIIDDLTAETLNDESAFELGHHQGLLIGGQEMQDVIIRRLRELGCATPLIALIDRRCSQTSIQMLNGGADDVMVKPINAAEVLERMNAIVRRTFGHPTTEIRIGEITAYFDGRDPDVDGQRIKLSHREHTIFTQLALRVGRVVSKETIYNAVYGMRDTQPFDKVVDVYICKLRKKLASYTNGLCYIETVYGRGYKLEAPLLTAPEPANKIEDDEDGVAIAAAG